MAYLMIVDDDEDFAAAAATVLRSAGHEVDVELDPDSAMENMANRCPDLVILDVMFPEDAVASFEAASAIRYANRELSKVPILMLTAVNAQFPLGFGPQDIDGDWLPVSDFVEKPVDLDVLKARADALFPWASTAGSDARSGDEQ